MDEDLALVRQWLEVMPEGRFDALPGRIAEDFVLRLPFAPPGVPEAFHGRDVAARVLSGSAANRSPLAFENLKILRTEDPQLFVATANASAVMASGRPYANSYVIFVRLREGQVAEHTEYLNPLKVIEAMSAS